MYSLKMKMLIYTHRTHVNVLKIEIYIENCVNLFIKILNSTCKLIILDNYLSFVKSLTCTHRVIRK